MRRAHRIVTIASLLIAVLASRVVAQDGAVEVRFSGPAARAPNVAMVSLLRDSGVVQQGETALPASRRFDGVAPGVYDVRVEGAGLVTEVKRGVHVTAHQTLNLQVVPRLGTGAHVVIYAEAVLSREEIETRLRRLEVAVDSLRHARPR